MEYLTTAIIKTSFGLKGEVKCQCLTSFPDLRFKKGNVFYLENPRSKEIKEVTLKSKKLSSGVLILGFEEITTPEEANAYKGFEVAIKKEDATVPKDHYRYVDLIGCDVFDSSNNKLGNVINIQSYSPKPNLVVKKDDNKTFSVPFVDAFIKDIDIENKKIIIEVWEGML